MGARKEKNGFTLIELLVAMGILSILAAIAISQYHNYRVRVYDTTAKADLKGALTAAENYFIENQTYPDDYTEILSLGFNLSKDVCFTKFHTHNSGAQLHLHTRHTGSPNVWHTRYPDDAGAVQHRNAESCL